MSMPACVMSARPTASSEALEQMARQESLALHVLELDVLSETACRSAVDLILARHGRMYVMIELKDGNQVRTIRRSLETAL